MKATSRVEANRVIAIADLQVQMFGSFSCSNLLEAVKKLSPDPATLRFAAYGEQKQFRLVADHSAEGEADDVAVISRQRQPDSGHGQQARALRPGPGLAEGRIEAFAHHVHDGVEVEKTAFLYVDTFTGHGIGLASAPRP